MPKNVITWTGFITRTPLRQNAVLRHFFAYLASLTKCELCEVVTFPVLSELRRPNLLVSSLKLLLVIEPTDDRNFAIVEIDGESPTISVMCRYVHLIHMAAVSHYRLHRLLRWLTQRRERHTNVFICFQIGIISSTEATVDLTVAPVSTIIDTPQTQRRTPLYFVRNYCALAYWSPRKHKIGEVHDTWAKQASIITPITRRAQTFICLYIWKYS